MMPLDRGMITQSATRINATNVVGHTFTVSEIYDFSNSKILGRGTYGVVATSLDTVNNRVIAIKRIRPFANDDWDARHTLREIRLLRVLGQHPNIISLYSLSCNEDKAELYMMMELMDCDLHKVIQSKQVLSMKHIRCFMKQILEGIKAMHDVGVFHRDLKPGNILVSKDCQIRITDFGLARFMDEATRQGDNKLNPMTEYVVTRWYRAPELLLSPGGVYNEAIDLWSIGCIFAELIRRKPLFPGKSHAHQVQLVFELLGYDPDNLGFAVTLEAFQYLDRRSVAFSSNAISLRQALGPDASDDAIDLVEHLLTVNPNHRCSACIALQSLFVRGADVLNDYSKTYIRRPHMDDFDFEHEKYTLDELKGMIQDEIRFYDFRRSRSGSTTIGSSGTASGCPSNRGSFPASATPSSRNSDESISFQSSFVYPSSGGAHMNGQTNGTRGNNSLTNQQIQAFPSNSFYAVSLGNGSGPFARSSDMTYHESDHDQDRDSFDRTIGSCVFRSTSTDNNDSCVNQSINGSNVRDSFNNGNCPPMSREVTADRGRIISRSTNQTKNLMEDGLSSRLSGKRSMDAMESGDYPMTEMMGKSFRGMAVGNIIASARSMNSSPRVSPPKQQAIPVNKDTASRSRQNSQSNLLFTNSGTTCSSNALSNSGSWAKHQFTEAQPLYRPPARVPPLAHLPLSLSGKGLSDSSVFSNMQVYQSLSARPSEGSGSGIANNANDRKVFTAPSYHYPVTLSSTQPSSGTITPHSFSDSDPFQGNSYRSQGYGSYVNGTEDGNIHSENEKEMFRMSMEAKSVIPSAINKQIKPSHAKKESITYSGNTRQTKR